MKLNRNSKKWKGLYLERLIKNVLNENDVGKCVIAEASEASIKEAEEYADRLFSAMR